MTTKTKYITIANSEMDDDNGTAETSNKIVKVHKVEPQQSTLLGVASNAAALKILTSENIFMLNFCKITQYWEIIKEMRKDFLELPGKSKKKSGCKRKTVLTKKKREDYVVSLRKRGSIELAYSYLLQKVQKKSLRTADCFDFAMADQQFFLKWNDFQTNMVTSFRHLRDQKSFTDVTLACEGQTCKAHKMVLSACSPYFKSLLEENPSKHPIIILKDVSYMHLQAILEFMYAGEVNVSQEQLPAFLKTADRLKVKGLAETPSSIKREEYYY